MKNSDYTDDQVTRWRRYVDKCLLLSWKTVLIIAGVWVLSVVLHKAMYGPFSDHFGIKDGLGSDHVNAIFQDRNGDLWFGTDLGVSRYDGTSWQTFTTNDGLADNRVPAILQDRKGDLWFGTWGGVSRYDGASWQTFTTNDGLAGNHVDCILQDRDGNLWFGTRAGLSRYDGASWQTFTTNDCLVAYAFCSILEDTDGNLWFGAHCGASRYDGTSWQTFTRTDGLADDEIMSSLQDTDGNLWFGTCGGVSRYDGTSWQTFMPNKIGLVPNAASTFGTAVIPVYFIISLVYTVIMKPDEYLLLSRRPILIIPALVLLPPALYRLFYEHYTRAGEGAVFMILLLVIPLYFIISLVYTLRTVGKRLRNRAS